MKNNRGFIISTTLYSVFGILLLTIFYILYILANNRMTMTTSINDLKSELEKVRDNSPNKPVLADGMIPVVYSDSNNTWKVADKTSNWYNYDELKWANAVTVTSGSRSEYLRATPGTEISMDDITTMWVWIPRYKYKRSNRIGLDYENENPSQIDVIFENGTDTTGEGYEKYADIYETGQDIDYYFTHPAFTFGGEELTGFWASKFEIGYHEAMFKTGYYIPNIPSEYFDGDEYVIKPDVFSLCSVGEDEVGIVYPDYDTNYIKTLFKASLAFAGGKINGDGSVVFEGNDRYGLTSNNDTHLMKLYDWSAVAYLSNSQYGKSANSSYSAKNKEIYFNNSTAAITGRSAGAPAGSFTVNQSYCEDECNSAFDVSLWYGYYTYNDIQYYDSNEYYNMGTGASTTGTIYGVYDMVGGCQEFAINSNTFSNLDQKYYENNILIKTFGIATSETSSWYNDSYEEGFCGGGGARMTYDSGNSYDSRYGVFQPPCIDGVNYSYEYSADFEWIYDAPNKIGGHAVLIP